MSSHILSWLDDNFYLFMGFVWYFDDWCMQISVQKRIFPRTDETIKTERSKSRSDVLPWTDSAFIHLGCVNHSIDRSKHSNPFLEHFLLLLMAFGSMGMCAIEWTSFKAILPHRLSNTFLAKCADHADFSRKYRMGAHPYYLEQDIQFSIWLCRITFHWENAYVMSSSSRTRTPSKLSFQRIHAVDNTTPFIV